MTTIVDFLPSVKFVVYKDPTYLNVVETEELFGNSMLGLPYNLLPYGMAHMVDPEDVQRARHNIGPNATFAILGEPTMVKPVGNNRLENNEWRQHLIQVKLWASGRLFVLDKLAYCFPYLKINDYRALRRSPAP